MPGDTAGCDRRAACGHFPKPNLCCGTVPGLPGPVGSARPATGGRRPRPAAQSGRRPQGREQAPAPSHPLCRGGREDSSRREPAGLGPGHRVGPRRVTEVAEGRSPLASGEQGLPRPESPPWVCLDRGSAVPPPTSSSGAERRARRGWHLSGARCVAATVPGTSPRDC